jgi:hypothetical protein
MKHLAACFFSIVLALAWSDRAHAQTVTSTSAQTSTTAAVAETTTASVAQTPQKPPKRVRRKITANLSSDYRNPQGSILASFFFGGGYSSQNGAAVALGLGFGYAVITGVVPGVRGIMIASGDGVAGEVMGTLTLTPPLTWSITPFAQGEAGYRGDGDDSGVLYGAGIGAFLGDPGGRVALQLGWIWRRLNTRDDRNIDASGPLLGITYRN